VSRENNPAGLGILAAAAALEYVFPPFPGDTITLFGAVLITAYGWSFAGVFGAVMLGSVAGSMIAYGFGHKLGTWRRRRPARERTERRVLDELIDRFERHGAIYLTINRFLPGIRALFFVAAGMANIRPLPVAFYAALSAALWNLGLIAAGSLLGANMDELLSIVKTYSTVVWIVIAAIVITVVGRTMWRRRRARRASGG
jgi:membrane protein DedA with SNARE-associated domain